MLTDDEFHRKMQQVKELNEHWSLKKEVGFQVFENLSAPSSAMQNDYENGRCEEDHLENVDQSSMPIHDALHDSATEHHHSVAMDSAEEQMTETIAPFGSEKTNVIGLPKKKKGKGNTLSRFVDIKNSEKEKQVLAWCVGEDVSKSCVGSGNKITEDVIDPTEISASLYNEFVNIQSISYWFETDAWNKFMVFFDAKSASFVNRCSSCSKVDVSGDDLINCDHCLLNFHNTCGRVKKIAKKRSHWFCNRYKINFKSSEQDTENTENAEN